MGGMIGALAWLILGIDKYLNWPALAIAIINVVLIVMFMIVIIIVIYHRQENFVYIKNTLLKRILK